jgi:hypothetical protein
MRTLIAIVLSSALVASTAIAAEVGPLAPGKPAGVKQAQIGTTGWVLIGTAAIAAIAIGVASGSNGSPNGGSTPLAVTATTI